MSTSPNRGLAEREPLAADMQAAFARLLQGFDLAQQVQRSVWELAVPIGELRVLGLTDDQLRWLLHQGYVEHAVETTQPGDPRTFQFVGGTVFSERSCFVLTETGAAQARTVILRPDADH